MDLGKAKADIKHNMREIEKNAASTRRAAIVSIFFCGFTCGVTFMSIVLLIISLLKN